MTKIRAFALSNKRQIPLERYIELALEASSRVRRILVVVSVAAVIIGSAVWNSRPGDWFRADIQELRITISDTEKSIPIDPVALEHFRSTPEGHATIQHLEMLRKLYITAQAKLLDQTFFEAKFFGVHFHTNDLGLIGGIGLCSVMFLLMTSIRREKENYETVFKQALQRKSLPQTYALLCMGQVFTTPPSPARPRLRTARYISKFFFVAPIFVQAGAVLVDQATYAVFAKDRVWTTFNLATSWVCLLIISAFGLRALILEFQYDKVWLAAALEIAGMAVEAPSTSTTPPD